MYRLALFLVGGDDDAGPAKMAFFSSATPFVTPSVGDLIAVLHDGVPWPPGLVGETHCLQASLVVYRYVATGSSLVNELQVFARITRRPDIKA